jgi:LacI family transcriptional regulator
VPGRTRNSGHVTILDVARESGFSASTVSIVLNEAPLSRYVAAKTKERIRQTALTLGYRPDAFARSLRRRRSHTIGVMVFDISDPFCTLILRGIEQTLYPTPYLPIMMDAQNQQKQFDAYLEMLLERRVEGLIVVANWLFTGFDLLAEMERHQIPTVVVGGDLTAKGITSVQVDNVAGGYMAIEHLHALGHREIAFIRGPEKLIDSVRRWEGVERFAAESGLKLDDRLVRQQPAALDPFSGFEAGLNLTNDLLRSGVPFTALMASDDLTALGAIRALYEARRDVPGEISVVGFDDVPTAAVCSPGLTTVRQPMVEMGTVTAEWVLKAIRDSSEEPAAQPASLLKLLPPEMVVRGSTACRGSENQA